MRKFVFKIVTSRVHPSRWVVDDLHQPMARADANCHVPKHLWALVFLGSSDELSVANNQTFISPLHPPLPSFPLLSLNGGLGELHLGPLGYEFLATVLVTLPVPLDTMSYSNNNPFGAHSRQQLYPALPDPQQHTHGFPHIHNPFHHAPGHQAPGQSAGALVPVGAQELPAGQVIPAPTPFGTGSTQPLNPYGASYNPAAATSGWRQPYGFSYTTSYTASRVQAPQAIEEPAKDEDATYGPLGRARSKIERAMVSDNEISLDLVDKLQQRECGGRGRV